MISYLQVVIQALLLQQSHNIASGHVEQRTMNLNRVPAKEVRKMSPGYRGCPSTLKKRKQLFNAEERVERKAGIGRRQQKESGKNHKIVRVEEDQVHIPKHMIGFGVPNEPRLKVQRKLPEAAIGPPYFYFENVACAPKGVWSTISRSLYEVEPEFVDSLHFCPAARKRGYVHNLPICDRFPLKPIPPLTIQAALPLTKKWWPSWDRRDKFTCLRTRIGSAKLTERIKEALERCNGDPPLETQKYVLYQCKKWNLVWTGKNKATPLEPDEQEMLMGYPQNHTRGASRTERYKTLGNSFQVDTVAYHFSVLKRMFPNGITVLSLFTGIGGAEIALHRLGIPLKAVVSVEVSEVSRSIFRSWWEQTNQTGDLIELEDVQLLSEDKLKIYISSFGGFDLVVGGSPCNNLTGSNFHHRNGLKGEHSVLFFEFDRILDTVKCMMASNL
ncbi:hypothetical protein IFM89_016563 [Coptis chinensis]|uniref:DNA (cytosine-5-)-methyltransferase n=1 Tax=Coptis chinensis TaxID=261450 RepID=A0A835IB72_9MAGN|nr:hypothetical protein IFM89_016563 [Coptis chinensis]